MRILSFILCSFILLHAQITGNVNYESLGIQFNVPDGWKGQKTEAAFIMGSDIEAGYLLITTSQAKSLDQLKQEANDGIFDENIYLTRSKEFENLSSNTVGAEFEGTVQFQPAKAYVAGMINPHGQSLTIMAVTDQVNFSTRYRELVLQIVNSVKFSKPEKPAEADNWQQLLNNTRLTYMNTYNSSSYDSYGGYSDKEAIDLCSAGYFKFNSSSSMSFDTGGGYGYSADSGQGAGTWEVAGDAAGNPLLRLNFYNGDVKEYKLEMQDGKTFLNGYRYFRIGVGDPNGNGPQCP